MHNNPFVLGPAGTYYSRWKIRDRRHIKNAENTQTKHIKRTPT